MLFCLESSRRASASRSPRPIRSRSSRTPAATRGPASEPRPASSTPATSRTPKERSKRNSLAAVLRPPLPALEDADLLGGPIRGEGLADEPVSGDRSPESAVVALSTIVAHHEVMVRRNGDLPREIAFAARAARAREVILGPLAVHDRHPVRYSQGVPWAGDDAFDEVDVRLLRRGLRAGGSRRAAGAALVAALGALRRMEDDDVPDLGVGEVVEEAVHQDPLADVERGLHRLGRDLVGLDNERLDSQRQPEGERDDDHELAERARGALGAWDLQPSAFSEEARSSPSGVCSGALSEGVSAGPASAGCSAALAGASGAPASFCSSARAWPSASPESASGSASTTSGSASTCATPSASVACASSSATSWSASMPQRRSATRALLPTFSRR